MTSIAPYTKIPYSNRTSAWVNWIDTLIETGMIRHEDIPVFNFRPLGQIRNALRVAGYNTEEIEDTINGLSELPEYASQGNTNEASGR